VDRRTRCGQETHRSERSKELRTKIALALASQDRFKIEGFVAAHFGDSGAPQGIESSVAAIKAVLEKAGMTDRVPVKRGAPPFQYSAVPVESEGVDCRSTFLLTLTHTRNLTLAPDRGRRHPRHLKFSQYRPTFHRENCLFLPANYAKYANGKRVEWPKASPGW